MPGQQLYIYQKNNLLPDASVSCNVSPSEKPPLIYPVAKRGNGNIKLYGNFTGQVDARYDVKVLDTALEVPVVSAPTFRGAGTGRISDIRASDMQAQKVEVICLSTGTDTTRAEVVIEGLRFRSKTPGSPGNAIYIVINDSMLEFTQTDYSTIKPLKVGDTALEGQEWDFGTKVLQGSLVPADAHRIAFGLNKLHIYRQYKKFEEGKWKYYFILPIQYDVKAGSRVFFVTGGRRITVTNGSTTEVYTGIITIADFWQKVRETSNLIEPADSSIDTSLNVSSPAVREFATKTDAYFLPPYRDEKSSVYAGELDGIAVTNSAKTELIKLECADNSYIGQEIWNVKGSSSGEMGQARSGQIANFGHVSFLIPQKFPKDWGTVKEDWSYKVDYQVRNENEVTPPICFSLKQGISSIPQTLTLEYKRKPAECTCPTVSFSDKCLGLSQEGGEIGMAYTVPDLLFWTDAQIEVKKETYVSGYQSGWVEEEQAEGRSGAYGKYNVKGFDIAVRDYVTNFKALAQRIMNLPEDSPLLLQSMVDVYKSLIASLTVYPMDWRNPFGGVDPTFFIPRVGYMTSVYASLTDSVLNYERTYGVKKNSVVAFGTCYIDVGSEYYWEVRGAKAYLDAFTDVPYYSTVRHNDQYANTREFAFNISTPCGGALKIGDKITVEIGGTVFERTYQLGDLTYLPTIAQQNLHFHGGIDGDDLYTFGVRGEIDTFPAYSLDRTAPARYYHRKLSFQIEDGIVPFQVGDVFGFAIEGGHFVWRKDGGAWSSALQITQDLQSFDSGLRIGFDFGVTPSFMQGDLWEVLCVQENRTANMLTPWRQRWKGSGDITIAFPAPVTVDCLIIDNHTLADTVVLKASDSPDFSPLIHNAAIAVSGLVCKLPAITAQYFRIETGSDEAEIGHIFLGTVMQLDLDADSVAPVKRYNMMRSNAREPFSRLRYKNHGYEITHKSFVRNPDWKKLEELIEYVKSRGDMPFFFVPNFNYPGDCIRGSLYMDSVEPESPTDMNSPEDARLYKISLTIRGRE